MLAFVTFLSSFFLVSFSFLVVHFTHILYEWSFTTVFHTFRTSLPCRAILHVSFPYCRSGQPTFLEPSNSANSSPSAISKCHYWICPQNQFILPQRVISTLTSTSSYHHQKWWEESVILLKNVLNWRKHSNKRKQSRLIMFKSLLPGTVQLSKKTLKRKNLA